MLDNGCELSFHYNHLSRLSDDIHPGARVRKGRILGYAGNTGTSSEGTGSDVHLDFCVEVGGRWIGQGLSLEETQAVYRHFMAPYRGSAGGALAALTLNATLGLSHAGVWLYAAVSGQNNSSRAKVRLRRLCESLHELTRQAVGRWGRPRPASSQPPHVVAGAVRVIHTLVATCGQGGPSATIDRFTST